jgi:HEAT repeat protein
LIKPAKTAMRATIDRPKKFVATVLLSALLIGYTVPIDRVAAQEPAEPAPAEPAPAEPATPEPAPADPGDAFGAPPEGEPAMEEPPAEEPAMEEQPADPAEESVDAFGGPDAGAAEGEAAIDEKPARPARPKPKDAEPAEPALPTDPAVIAILESAPATPVELVRAIDILVDLQHAALAKPYVDKLAQQQLDPATKTALVDRFNAATLVKLARDKELGPSLAPMVDDWLRSAEAYRRDAQRLAAAAAQLSDPNEITRAQAGVLLLRARESAVAPLVNILADPKRTAEHAAARQMLVSLGDLAVAPLLGVLESPDTSLQAQAIAVLGAIGSPHAVPQLLAYSALPSSPSSVRAAAAGALRRITGRTPAPDEAIAMLERAVRAPLEHSRREDLDTAAPAVLWHWNAKVHQSMPIVYDVTGASLAQATRLARQLYLVDPQRVDRCRLYLTAMLQAAKFRGGLDKPLATGPGTAYAVAAYYGPSFVEHVLAGALAEGYTPAAAAAAQVLGDIGSPALLTGGAEPSPLVQAARHTDRRLRFAAIGAIMKLDPREPFAGSSQVTAGLGFFARSHGVPRALIVHPRSDEAQKVAGLAIAMGYEADIATDARRAFELAAASPDLEFVLAHSAISRPDVDYLVAQLRRDKRTSLVPVGLMAPIDDLARIERYAAVVPRTIAFLQPQNEAEMKLHVGDVLARAGRWRVSPAERRAQANAAMDWLVGLSERPSRAFDLAPQEADVLSAMYVPELTGRAATVLGRLPVTSAQRSLLEVASSPTQPLAAREAAAAAFAHSREQFGLLLTRPEILQQYELYNSNAGRNADTNLVLGAVLDAIEGKVAPTGGQ